jgi:hypothetical protein
VNGRKEGKEKLWKGASALGGENLGIFGGDGVNVHERS